VKEALYAFGVAVLLVAALVGVAALDLLEMAGQP
jgi:hypothetical protein